MLNIDADQLQPDVSSGFPIWLLHHMWGSYDVELSNLSYWLQRVAQKENK